MRLLDLFCCGGGASMGYHRAGFEVVGVDINPQPHYPFTFVQADALDYLAEHGHEFDAIHASPPCQRFSAMTRAARTQDNHPDLLAPTREALRRLGKPYIIENVPGAPMENPIMLCGTMFPGLKVYRHRLFEGNVSLVAPEHGKHEHTLAKAGRPVPEHGWMSVVGHYSGYREAQRAMGIDWLPKSRLAEALPPAYTEYLGRQLMAHLTRES